MRSFAEQVPRLYARHGVNRRKRAGPPFIESRVRHDNHGQVSGGIAREPGSSVESAMRTSVATVPEELCRTTTWDQGARWPTVSASPWLQASHSTSAIPMLLGNVA